MYGEGGCRLGWSKFERAAQIIDFLVDVLCRRAWKCALLVCETIPILCWRVLGSDE